MLRIDPIMKRNLKITNGLEKMNYAMIQIRNGRLALGTWQGIYLNEHRDQGGWGGGHQRNIIITLQGQA